MRRSDSYLSPGRALASRLGFLLVLGAATVTVAVAQPAAAPPAPPAAPAAPAPPIPPIPSAGQPLRQQVEARFEVLPVSDGLLLRPKQPMDGIRALEVRDGQLAIDGREAEAYDLERRIGREAAAPVRALLELDPDELGELFGLAAAPAEEDDTEAQAGNLDREMEQRRSEIERQQEEIRQRIEREMERRADDVQQRQEDVARQVERAVRRGAHRGDGDARVVMGTPVHVRPGESTGDVVAIGGGITVDGEVLGDAVSVGGSEHVTGLVTGNTVSVGGTIHLGPKARVMGDVVSIGGSVEREPGAEILGRVTEVSLWQGLAGGGMGLGGLTIGRGWDIDTGHSYFDGALLRFMRSIVFVLVLILLGALAAVIGRQPMERISAAAGAQPWKAGVVGILSIILFVPAMLIVLVLLAVSIVGIPLILLWPFAVLACVFAAFFGYLASAHALARWSENRFGWRLQGPVTTIVLGLFLLHGAWLMARLVDVVDSSRNVGGFLRLMLLLFWMLVNLGAAFVGVGAVILARRGGGAPVPLSPALPPPLPVTPPPAPRYEAPVVEGPAVESLRHDEREWEEPFADFEEPEPSTSAATVVTAAPTADIEPAEEPGDEAEEEKRRQA
ncbi:MAG TPA: hypothetical protein VN923_20020 [Thermoanaerobaculia bacterium]|nr:hypothetical protein [Thermoanaerobaculia bacterium]